VPERRFHIRITVGEPVAASRFREPNEAASKSARRLTQWLLSYYASPHDGGQGDARPEAST
jgi:hypothetical protein